MIRVALNVFDRFSRKKIVYKFYGRLTEGSVRFF